MRKPKDALDRLARHGEVLVLGSGEDGGAVRLQKPGGTDCQIVFSWGMNWDHVSVSVIDPDGDRCPVWAEMEMVSRAFFKDRETAMQLHVPLSDHINCHPYCLHLWRPQRLRIPRPPAEMVGPR
jgi:hypothetical protein